MKNLTGKIVLITGGAQGIGRELAFRFVRDKARLVIIDIVQEALNRTTDELRKAGAEVHPYIQDVTDREGVYKLAERVRKEVGTVDVLVNNAGVVWGGDFLTMGDQYLQKTMDINVNAYMWFMKAFMPDMAKRNEGHVVNIASAAGLLGVAGLAVYCASKHAVVGLTESVRVEMKKRHLTGIKFTTVCPSFINTELFAGVRAPWFVPLLTPGRIADRIYAGVKKDKIIVREPFFVKVTPFFKAISPINLFDWYSTQLGIHRAVDNLKRKG